MDSRTLGIVLVAYAILLWLLLFFAWRRGYQEWWRNRANRLRRFSARVMDKRKSTVPAEDTKTSQVVEHLVTFQFGGRQNEYEVEAPTYDAVRVGQEGTLYLKGGRFEKFEPRSESEEAEEIYRRLVGS